MHRIDILCNFIAVGFIHQSIRILVVCLQVNLNFHSIFVCCHGITTHGLVLFCYLSLLKGMSFSLLVELHGLFMMIINILPALALISKSLIALWLLSSPLCHKCVFAQNNRHQWGKNCFVLSHSHSLSSFACRY